MKLLMNRIHSQSCKGLYCVTTALYHVGRYLSRSISNSDSYDASHRSYRPLWFSLWWFVQLFVRLHKPRFRVGESPSNRSLPCLVSTLLFSSVYADVPPGARPHQCHFCTSTILPIEISWCRVSLPCSSTCCIPVRSADPWAESWSRSPPSLQTTTHQGPSSFSRSRSRRSSSLA